MGNDKLIVFDIKRFAVHDGPGIRTSLFLKGCPLNCKWCHNPEGISPQPQLWYFPGQCLHCGDCIEICPGNALSFGESQQVIIDRDKCTNCGLCTNVCPSKSLVIIGIERTIQEVETELLKDVLFYSESSGGITLTGGEPLLQSKCILPLLRLLKKSSIHITIESCLHIPASVIDEILPFVDLFLVDLKIFDSNWHKESTGVDNALILSNIKKLFKTSKKIIIRVPLIPDYTNSIDNLKRIATFVSSANRAIPIELMNFNPLARDKFGIIGKPYAPEGFYEPFTESEMEKFREIFRAYNLTVK